MFSYPFFIRSSSSLVGGVLAANAGNAPVAAVRRVVATAEVVRVKMSRREDTAWIAVEEAVGATATGERFTLAVNAEAAEAVAARRIRLEELTMMMTFAFG